MDLKITNETIDTNVTVFEGKPEQGFESDILLPDYCPDVRRILKCHVKPKISQCYPNGDKVNVDGFIFVKIYYVCDENKIHAYDTKIPFSKVLELKSTVDHVTVAVYTQTSYVNCRAVNQRRFDIRGAVNIGARVTAVKSESILADAVGDGVQLKRKTVSATTVHSDTDTPFSVREEGSVENNPPVNAILRSDACAVLTEVKLIPNKMILKGELTVTTLYTDLEGVEPISVTHTFPISRIVDMEGIDTDSQSEVNVDVISVDTTPKQDENGNFTMLSFDVKLNVMAKAYDTKNFSAATDAYSTQYACDYTSKPITFEKLVGVVDESLTVRESLDLGSAEIERIIDLWTDAHRPTVKTENGVLKAEIPVDVFTFVQQKDGNVELKEKRISSVYEYALPQECREATFEPEVRIVSCDYAFAAPNKADVKVQLKITGAVLCKTQDACICELTVDETKPKAREDEPALTIYYCDSGERVWDIAKRYNTSAERIMAENDLGDETVTEKRVILIPTVK